MKDKGIITSDEILSTINSNYAIMSRDRKYIVTGKGYYITIALVNRSWRPRMFKTKDQASALFEYPYDWGYCSTDEIKISHIYGNASADKKRKYYKNLLDNYFDIVKIGVVELRENKKII